MPNPERWVACAASSGFCCQRRKGEKIRWGEGERGRGIVIVAYGMYTFTFPPLSTHTHTHLQYSRERPNVSNVSCGHAGLCLGRTF
jgi:hypothetical protein